MLVLNIDHPDVIDFITAKLDINKINGANISLAITDEFMNAYVNDLDWKLVFETKHESIMKTAKARDIMKLLSYATHTVGDPGVLFIDNVNNYHLLSEYSDVRFTATNPCGEQPLLPYSSCNLGSINLNAFVKKPFTEEALFDFQRFEEVVEEMVKGLDLILDLYGDRHPLEKQKSNVKNWREIGLGVMGLADVSLSMKIGYGTSEFITLLDKIMHTMINKAVQISAFNAKEKGSFPNYNYELISNSRFFNEALTDETKEIVRQNGLRNSRLLSIAPNGSISNALGVSGGCEPYFMLGYQRTIKSMFEDEKNIWVYEKTPLKLMKYLGIENHEQLPEWAKITSQNIKFEDRAKVQATIQKYVDTAISSTFNIPNSATVEDIENIYVKAWELGLKGATVFRDNCKKIGILTGGGGNMDNNPAMKPKITIKEHWYNKYENTSKDYITEIVVENSNYSSIKQETELCPICGNVLIKKGGCTKCSNNECYFEKCSL